MAQTLNKNQLGQLVTYVMKTNNFTTTSTSQTLITGLTSGSFTVPTGGGVYYIKAYFSYIYNSGTGAYTETGIWDGTPGSGAQLGWLVTLGQGGAASSPQGGAVETIASLAAGSHTINIGASVTGNTGTWENSSVRPGFLLIQRIA